MESPPIALLDINGNAINQKDLVKATKGGWLGVARVVLIQGERVELGIVSQDGGGSSPTRNIFVPRESWGDYGFIRISGSGKPTIEAFEPAKLTPFVTRLIEVEAVQIRRDRLPLGWVPCDKMDEEKAAQLVSPVYAEEVQPENGFYNFAAMRMATINEERYTLLARSGDWFIEWPNGNVEILSSSNFDSRFRESERDRDIAEIGERVDMAMQRVYATNKRRGFTKAGERKNFAELIAMIHSELSEALEADRRAVEQRSKKIPAYTEKEDELADVLIRSFSLSAEYRLRLGAALVAKMRYNEEQPPGVDGGKRY